MLDVLKRFIAEPETTAVSQTGTPPVYMAAAALLVEAALADGIFDPEERLQIKDVLLHMFSLSDTEASSVIVDAEEVVAQSNQLYGFSRTIRDTFDYDRRVELMQMLWEVVYADGRLDDFEANLIRRVSGLLYVSDQDSGRARKAALEQLGIDSKTLTVEA